MSCVLKCAGKDEYLKMYEPRTGKITFTKDSNEAKTYDNDWFADTEKSQLMFYSKLPPEEGGLVGDPKEIKELVPKLAPCYL